MSAAHPLRMVAFGDLETGVWGVAWATVLAAGIAGEGESVLSPVAIEGADEGAWRIGADAAELEVAPVGEALGAGHGLAQLCRVRGRFLLAGSERAVDCLGHRGSRADGEALRRYESVREVAAWFEPDEGVALQALRARESAGHADDAVTAAVFEAAGAVAVADPRLSTTYTADGAPARMSLELWLGDEEDEEQQYPRRAAGEAVGARADALVDGLEIHAELLRCHSRGRDGAGVYMLARAR